MRIRTAARRGAAAAVLAATIVLGTSGCGQGGSTTAAAPSTTAAPTTEAATPSATTAASATASETTAEAPAAGEDGSGAKIRVDPDGTVDGPQLARNISDQLVRIVGRAPASLTCPDLQAKVGANITCTLTDSGETYTVAVNATKVQGSDVSFDFRVADQPS